jgi:hypothetical protein
MHAYFPAPRHHQAWRHHPLLKMDKRNMVPGLGLGVVFFLAFKAWEASAPAPEHH